MLIVGLDGEEEISSTVFSLQMITNRFSTAVSASPQDNADICLLSSSIRSESMMVPTGEAWENTKRDKHIIIYQLVMTYKLCAFSTTLFPVVGFEEHPTRRMIACYGRDYQ